ncbi:sugar kinase [Actinomadura viridis]|uniref:Sugar/nucleoside kinase (Ribokinase family) n=1 Tax=Actinomadura viridis TaxID=58110 RepID=A0A931DMC0_9ACTN|nr:PfkB family carbohydrate kinase [Actinomadura viridis]MBG6090236.1 sugar/nucleoside kinase (ribokinase family) [Actinomadura viridis]
MDIIETPARSPVDWPGLDGVPERRFRLLAVGDVRIEVRALLPGLRFTELTSDRLAYAPARALVAGTAVNLARRAAGYFRDVGVLARIGDDDFTHVIRRELRRLGLRDLLRVEPGMPNGVTMMLRDGSETGGRGVRLLVAEEDSANRLLSERDVRDAAAEIRGADVLSVDGYALLSPVSRAAVLRAAEIARLSGTLVAFDLVPHDIDARLPASEVIPMLRLADVVISEAPTIARLLGRPATMIGSAEVRGLVPALDEAVPAPARPLWLLRFGPGSLEYVLARRRDGLLLEYPTGYGEGVERIGFGDRLAAGELFWWAAARASR